MTALTIGGVVALLTALLAAIPFFNRWFTKPTEQTIEDGAKAIEDQIQKERETGRP